jgi:hypothetical protein
MALHVYTCNNFKGLWPTGVAAVVVACDAEDAELMLRNYLTSQGLPQPADRPLVLERVSLAAPKVTVLCNGDY